ncbi:MAG TPA: glycosyltransferase family 39 protein [Gemmataceae bacterium]|nr:glycosyltransferase family 39 protein [Gemmataceae bacterium]
MVSTPHSYRASVLHSLKTWAVALIALGVLWRTVRYLWRFPLWGDEAFVCLNFLDRGYRELIQPLRFHQVAPLLFLWGEATVYRWLGGSELALRLLPFLAGLGSLALFWRLAWRSLPPRGALLATGILAIAYYPVRHSCEAKPYAFDLLMALAILVPALSWLQEPYRWRWLLILTLLTPVALGLSYPAVLIAAAVSLVLLPAVWRQPGWARKSLFVAYVLLLSVSFLVYYGLAGLGQHASMDKDYWKESFPPAQPVALLIWLWHIHTGNLFAYPIGSHHGGSTLTFLLCLVGVWHLGRDRSWQLLAVSLLPFGLTMVAAALHRYPYGGSARVAQHLAPVICLLAGTGLAALIERIPSFRSRRHALFATCGCLAFVGACGLLRDFLKPYKTDDHRLVRQVIDDVLRRSANDDQVVIMDSIASTGPTFEWYLRQAGDRICWNGQIDWQRLSLRGGHLWCVYFDRGHAARDRFLGPDKAELPLTLAAYRELELHLGTAEGKPEYCAVQHWVCEAGILRPDGNGPDQLTSPTR